MQLRQRHQFTTIRTEGSILPADLLQRINEREPGLAGLKPEDYHLPGNLKLNEAINQSWNRLLGAWTAFHPALEKLPETDTATTLTRQAYVEFDLEAMMNGELYADFALFWLLCHESRVHAEKPQDCWLEKWSKAAQDQGTRALEQLRRGVEEAIEALGRGFLAHASNHALPALGSFLFSREAIPDLEACDIANAHLLDAVRALAFINDRHGRRLVDYKNLRSEELGSVYEALLELLPDMHIEARLFELKTVSGSERKSTGSYYTPESLVQCLLDSALEPVVAETLKQPDAAQAILRLKVCDPACGSGHFLIAAAHRLAKHLASVRTGDHEPAPEAVRTALRDVIGHCIYGVDANPMAVELCKVSLWMEALEPGKPLSFLDHRIQCGNSLLGATPALLNERIPGDAFKPIEGHDRTGSSGSRKQNKQEREGQQRLFAHAPEPGARVGNLATGLLQLEEISDDSIAGVPHKHERWE